MSKSIVPPAVARLLVLIAVLFLAGCASATQQVRPTPPAWHAAAAMRAAPGVSAPDRQALQPVLVAGHRVFAVDGPATAPAEGELIGTGPTTLRVAAGASLEPSPVTIVGADGTCVATATRAVTVWSPNAAFATRELAGCADLAARATSVLVAVDGAHPDARWLDPIAGEVRALPSCSLD